MAASLPPLIAKRTPPPVILRSWTLCFRTPVRRDRRGRKGYQGLPVRKEQQEQQVPSELLVPKDRKGRPEPPDR